jgi:hypothetical protein
MIMQGKNRNLIKRIVTVFFSYWMISVAQSAVPVWTFEAQTPVDITVAKNSSLQVRYLVRNQSYRPKNLLMRPISGISQGSTCQLAAKGSCVLILNINGAALAGDVFGGPVLCQHGNPLQCYQPNFLNSLRIHLIDQPIVYYTITPSAGANGVIVPSTMQVVSAGGTLIFTAIPDSGFGVVEWLLDGNLAQSGGTTYQLNNIQADHTVEVTFGQTTLAALTQNLALSINAPSADPPLLGTPRIIRIENTGSVPASGIQVNASGLPAGTIITTNTCTGTLNPGATCDITITPSTTASSNTLNAACTTIPGSEPVPETVAVTAVNAATVNINVLVLGYGCIYEGGYLFDVDDATPNTGSIGGKVAGLTDEPAPTYQWATVLNNTGADSIIDGLSNTNLLQSPVGQYPAGQICFNKSDQGFTDWYLPAICELGRYTGSGADPGCGTANPNLYTTLFLNNLGGLTLGGYFSSTQFFSDPTNLAWRQVFNGGFIFATSKMADFRVRCIRIFVP